MILLSSIYEDMRMQDLYKYQLHPITVRQTKCEAFAHQVVFERSGIIKANPFWGNQTSYKSMANLRVFPL